MMRDNLPHRTHEQSGNAGHSKDQRIRAGDAVCSLTVCHSRYFPDRKPLSRLSSCLCLPDRTSSGPGKSPEPGPVQKGAVVCEDGVSFAQNTGKDQGLCANLPCGTGTHGRTLKGAYERLMLKGSLRERARAQRTGCLRPLPPCPLACAPGHSGLPGSAPPAPLRRCSCTLAAAGRLLACTHILCSNRALPCEGGRMAAHTRGVRRRIVRHRIVGHSDRQTGPAARHVLCCSV